MSQRRPKDESRANLLEAGRDEFIAARTGTASDVLAHLRLENIAKRAGYSGPGMIYNLWKDPEREAELSATPRELFLRDLLVEVATAPYRNNNITETIGSIAGEITDEVEFVRLVTNHEFGRIVDGLEEIYLPFWSLISGIQVAGVAEALEGVEKVALEELADIYQAGMAIFGFRMREPFVVKQLALALRSVQSGFAETYAIHREDRQLHIVERWQDIDDWTLFGVASYSVLDGMTESIATEDTSAD